MRYGGTILLVTNLFFSVLFDFVFVGLAFSMPEDNMQIHYGWSEKVVEAEAVTEAVTMMKNSFGDVSPKFVMIFATGVKYNEEKVFRNLKSSLKPGTKIWGMTTPERGLLVPEGRHRGLSVMGFYAPDLEVGIGSAALENWQDFSSYKEIGRKAMSAAMQDAGKNNREPPKVVLFAGLNLVTDTELFRGMEEIIGKDVPIVGGNSIDGQWDMAGGWGFSTNSVSEKRITIAAIWTKKKIGLAYGYGYRKTSFSGIATKSDFEKRILYEIDNKPAALVYNEWINGAITDLIKKGEGGQIDFAIFSKNPFGKRIGSKDEEYVMLAPLILNPDNSLFLTHEGIEQGKKITVYEIHHKDVVVKPAVVATLAMARGRIPKKDIAGALTIYCEAPFVAFQGDVNDMSSHFYKKIGEKPFLGIFASGEVGYSPKGGNRCLAYSSVVLVFGK